MDTAVAARDARIMVLGSMPGEKSLSLQQHYAHPRNAFWPIMSAVFDAPVDTYAHKLALICNNGLALWDVLQSCVRKGSLDQAIEKDSIIPNDFGAFFKRHSHIHSIFFNGMTAQRLFMRHVHPGLSGSIISELSFCTLPSTSPAMASLNGTAKLSLWRAALHARTSVS